MSHAFFSHRRLLRIAGPDAQHFLQGVVTCDVRPAFAGNAVYGALLTPQGKFLHDFFLYPYQDGVLLDCDVARIDDLLARLKMYRLRSKVELELMPQLGIFAKWGEGVDLAPQGGSCFVDPRYAQMGWRGVGPMQAPEGEDAYEQHRIALAMPDGARDMIVEKSLLMEMGFEQLHGVDFAKGCYIGQEVTARSKHRGQVRKQIYAVESGDALPPSGTPITQDGREVGMLRSCIGQKGLALLQSEAVESSAALAAESAVLSAHVPPWWTQK